jgi:hypothetical protein
LTDIFSRQPLKIGLLGVASAWFLLVFHELVKATYSINEYQYMRGAMASWVLVTDVFGLIAIIFRTLAALASIVGVVYYLFMKKGTSSANARNLVKWVLVAEAVYWLASFLPSGIWGFMPASISFGFGGNLPNLSFLINTGLPCLVEGILIPVLLLKAAMQLSPNKPQKNAIKWGLIAGVAYIFVFWLNNTSNWLNVAMQQTRYYTGADGVTLYPYSGIEYVTAYPDHILSFGLTTVGLLLVALYAAYFAKKSAGTENWRSLDLRRVGLVVTLVGLYFLVIYVMWLTVGTNTQQVLGGSMAVDVKWSEWYAWFLGHNLDLWVLSLPLVGLPLLFEKKENVAPQ